MQKWVVKYCNRKGEWGYVLRADVDILEPATRGEPAVWLNFEAATLFSDTWKRDNSWVDKVLVEPAKDGLPLSIVEMREAYHLFHKVWGDAASRSYNKQDWNRLQSLIEKVIYVQVCEQVPYTKD